jgi:cysteine synthase
MPMHPLSSVVDAIGNTPLVRLDRLVRARGLDGAILAKLDYLNPGFSKKDRAARGLIEQAERDGLLKPGQTVVELTSGNMGAGLAIVCGVKGYPFVAVMSKGNSPERARQMTALGAEVVLVDQLPESIPARSRAAIWHGWKKRRNASPPNVAPFAPINSTARARGTRIIARPVLRYGSRAAARWTPLSISPAPAAPMPA